MAKDVKQALLNIATLRSQEAYSTDDAGSATSLQMQATCLTRVADNATGTKDSSEDRKSAIIDAVVGECASWTSYDEATDFDGSSTWIKSILKVEQKVKKAPTLFDAFWDFATWD